MKKILFSLAAVAAMVGCAKDAPIVDNNDINQPVETLSISASIDLSDTRVTVDGEKFTDVKWAEGDIVRLASVAGVNTEMITTESGDTDVRFKGDAEYKADVDTYYAIYPSKDIKGGVVTFDLTTQNGKAATSAILASKTENAAKGVIDMAFRPINALLHVAVTGAPAISKAEFLSYDAAAFAAGFSYNFATEEITTTATASVLTVNDPNAEGFFFSLPADLNMSAGYIVRLTDTNGNICSKAYNGKIFAKGETTRVEIAWSQPTVTLGTPMTSYSYYEKGDATTANSCANNIIYFPTASTYANVQNAMVTEAGVIVDGKSYPAEFSGGKFTPANVTVSSWGEYTVYAYITTRDGKTINSPAQTVHITGLPYDYSFVNGSQSAYESAGWKWNGDMSVKAIVSRSKTLVMYDSYVIGFNSVTNHIGYIVSPKFELPSSVNVQPKIVRDLYNTNATNSATAIGYVGAVASKNDKNQSSTSISYTDNDTQSTNDTKRGDWTTQSFQLSQSYPYISISSNMSWNSKWLPANGYYLVYEAHFRYAE